MQSAKGTVRARFSAPRALVVSVVLHVLGFLTFATYTWVQLQIVKSELAVCKEKIAQHMAVAGGE